MQVPFGQRMEGKPCGQKPPPLAVYKKISNLILSNPFPCRFRIPNIVSSSYFSENISTQECTTSASPPSRLSSRSSKKSSLSFSNLLRRSISPLISTRPICLVNRTCFRAVSVFVKPSAIILSVKV